jgi:hypothetical protein
MRGRSAWFPDDPFAIAVTIETDAGQPVVQVGHDLSQPLLIGITGERIVDQRRPAETFKGVENGRDMRCDRKAANGANDLALEEELSPVAIPDGIIRRAGIKAFFAEFP